MIKLKLNNTDFKVLAGFTSSVIEMINKDIEQFMFNKKTVDLMLLHVQLHEMTSLNKKLAIKEINTRGMFDKKGVQKKYLFNLTPTQSFFFFLFLPRYQMEYVLYPGAEWTLQEQSDIIHKQLI